MVAQSHSQRIAEFLNSFFQRKTCRRERGEESQANTFVDK